MRFKHGIAVALLLATACSARDSGIEGRVTAGPSCPVMQENVPCPDQPYEATLSFLLAGSGIRVARVTTDADGYYRAYLAPGTYILHPESPGGLPYSSDVTVVVQPRQFTRQDVVYDTGIR